MEEENEGKKGGMRELNGHREKVARANLLRVCQKGRRVLL
jgi:hypothetical protein